MDRLRDVELAVDQLALALKALGTVTQSHVDISSTDTKRLAKRVAQLEADIQTLTAEKIVEDAGPGFTSPWLGGV